MARDVRCIYALADESWTSLELEIENGVPTFLILKGKRSTGDTATVSSLEHMVKNPDIYKRKVGE